MCPMNKRVVTYSSASCIASLVWALPALGKLLENIALLNAAIREALLKLDVTSDKWISFDFYHSSQ